ncbi:TPA: DUF551 domain-containing protein [Escherichia coli]|nr:DUF551 domain-containing protein [Escherichia coli]
MTTITKERLQWLANISGRDDIDDIDGGEIRELARIALVSLEAEPVAWTDEEELRDVRKYGFGEIFQCPPDKYADPRRVISLYRELPAPVVPDDWQLVPKKITLEMECALSKADSYEIGWLWALAAAPKYEVQNAKRVQNALNACRAAMLQSGNFRENKNSSTNNFREIAETSTNSPVIPDEVLSAIREVARIRADFDDFDGDRRGIGDCLDEAEQELIVTINKYASQLAAEPIATNDVREQTAVPPIQAVVAQAIEKLKRKLVECNRYNYCADAVKGVEYACHAAMLQGCQPVSQTYKFPVNTPCQDAPAHIWLQTAGVWPEDGELSELTWCSHNQHHDDTLYVRADLVNGNYPATPDSWISCSERMPNDKQYVWCWGKSYAWTECDTFEGYYDWSRNKWWAVTDDGEEPASKVTHWMPLPEPPQEVNRG